MLERTRGGALFSFLAVSLGLPTQNLSRFPFERRRGSTNTSRSVTLLGADLKLEPLTLRSPLSHGPLSPGTDAATCHRRTRADEGGVELRLSAATATWPRAAPPRCRLSLMTRWTGGKLATHSSVPVWRIPWTEEPGGYSPWGHKELDATEAT